MKRQHSPTSKAAHESIKPAKAYYHAKVVEGLEQLKGGGTFSQIADAVCLAPDKIWKRCSELKAAGIIFDTGITRPLPSGRQGTVWQLVKIKDAYADNVIREANTPASIQRELFT